MISAEHLSVVASAVREGLAEPDALRQRFPGIAFTLCSEDDIPARARPVCDAGNHALYLIGQCGSHCLSLTDDLDNASGIVVATKADDE